MLAIALELAKEDKVYEDVASKFFEHFVYISDAMNNLGKENTELWNEHDGFYYDVLHLPNERNIPLKLRSMVGLIPLFAVETLEEEWLEKSARFQTTHRVVSEKSSRSDRRHRLSAGARQGKTPASGDRQPRTVCDAFCT